MRIEPSELSDLLDEEERQVRQICDRWKGMEISERSMNAIRMGVRTKLLADLEYAKIRQDQLREVMENDE